MPSWLASLPAPVDWVVKPHTVVMRSDSSCSPREGGNVPRERGGGRRKGCFWSVEEPLLSPLRGLLVAAGSWKGRRGGRCLTQYTTGSEAKRRMSAICAHYYYVPSKQRYPPAVWHLQYAVPQCLQQRETGFTCTTDLEGVLARRHNRCTSGRFHTGRTGSPKPQGRRERGSGGDSFVSDLPSPGPRACCGRTLYIFIHTYIYVCICTVYSSGKTSRVESAARDGQR